MRTKVVHIVTRLDFGGAQQNTLYTAQHLDSQRFETLILCGKGGRLDPRASALRVRFIEDLVREISPLRDLAGFLQIYRVLREERPAIVHTHSSKAGILGRLAAALAGVPVILHTFHGFGFHERMSAAVRAGYVLAERITARVSTALIFVSRSNMEYAGAYGIGARSQFHLIRSGIVRPGHPAKGRTHRKALDLDAEETVVLSIGNLKSQKNCMDFIKVAGAVTLHAPETRFLYIGDGPMRPTFEAEVRRRSLEGSVRLLGWREDAGEVLAAADIFLLTSLWEGLPRALVEAMSSGLPCVAYNVDGVQDVLRSGSNGFAIDPADWRSAARMVSQLVRDAALREQLGRAAAGSIGTEFDIDEMVRRQEDLYDELTG